MKNRSPLGIREYMDQARQRGLSMRDIAERSGLPMSIIRGLMRGHISNPSLDDVHRLAKGLGVSSAEVLAPFGIGIGIIEKPPVSDNERRLIDSEIAYHVLLETHMGNPDPPTGEIDHARSELHNTVLAVIKERGIEIPKPAAKTPEEPADILDAEYLDDTDFSLFSNG